LGKQSATLASVLLGSRNLTTYVLSASYQNVFFGELLDALSQALADAGVHVERAVDHFPPLREGVAYVFVPHEFLPLVKPDGHPTEAQLRRTVSICTEQPGTSWFELDAEICARSGAVVDINKVGVAELQRRGVGARYLQLGYVPAWDTWHGDETHERPIDLAFMGGYTPRRAKVIAGCAQHLSRHRAAIHLSETVTPHLRESPHFLWGERKWRMLRDSRMIVNVHRSELGYLEWQRVIEAMVNGCVVVSEHSMGLGPFEPGRQLISVSADSVPAAVEALVGDEERLARIRMSAYRFLRDEMPLSRSIATLVDALEDLPKVPMPQSTVPTDGPLPLAPQQPVSAAERVAQQRGELDVVRMALKHVIQEQRALRAQLRSLGNELTGRQAGDRREAYGPELPSEPGLSVVLTVHDHANTVASAIESVAASDFHDVELVVIDDASTDASGAVISRTLSRCPWLAATVVTRSCDGGLAAARNLGVEEARGELVFVLDADNLVYPHAFDRLSNALDDDPHAHFAYGIIEQFDDRGPCDLTSWLGWDPGRLRHGNFVDAMAMIRRKSVQDAGGYTSDARLHGWEEFALWCAFADRGWLGVRVPEIVARQRLGLGSRASLTNIDTSVAWSALLSRFAVLAPHAGSVAT
jgi:hypothetical protein